MLHQGIWKYLKYPFSGAQEVDTGNMFFKQDTAYDKVVKRLGSFVSWVANSELTAEGRQENALSTWS